MTCQSRSLGYHSLRITSNFLGSPLKKPIRCVIKFSPTVRQLAAVPAMACFQPMHVPMVQALVTSQTPKLRNVKGKSTAGILTIRRKYNGNPIVPIENNHNPEKPIMLNLSLFGRGSIFNRKIDICPQSHLRLCFIASLKLKGGNIKILSSELKMLYPIIAALWKQKESSLSTNLCLVV